jgi:hypothetical protein
MPEIRPEMPRHGKIDRMRRQIDSQNVQHGENRLRSRTVASLFPQPVSASRAVGALFKIVVLEIELIGGGSNDDCALIGG